MKMMVFGFGFLFMSRFVLLLMSWFAKRLPRCSIEPLSLPAAHVASVVAGAYVLVVDCVPPAPERVLLAIVLTQVVHLK